MKKKFQLRNKNLALPNLYETSNSVLMLFQEAYRRWVCSSLLPFYSETKSAHNSQTASTWRRVRPCRSLCRAVEQQCPYFLPADAASGYPTQYAGEATFHCSGTHRPTRKSVLHAKRWKAIEIVRFSNQA